MGGTYTGDLAASEALQLVRADGSIADTLTYGGAGWPVSGDGRSLELVDPAADNSGRSQLGAVDLASGLTRSGEPNRRHRDRSGRTDSW